MIWIDSGGGHLPQAERGSMITAWKLRSFLTDRGKVIGLDGSLALAS